MLYKGCRSNLHIRPLEEVSAEKVNTKELCPFSVVFLFSEAPKGRRAKLRRMNLRFLAPAVSEHRRDRQPTGTESVKIDYRLGIIE